LIFPATKRRRTSHSGGAQWKHTQLTLDVVPGQGGMFSLENGQGIRFHIRSKLFSDAEVDALKSAGRFGKGG
jgi:uncharacterized protein (DUF779 family)